jgi:hypothetical protein
MQTGSMLNFSMVTRDQIKANLSLQIAPKHLFPKILPLSSYNSIFWRNYPKSPMRNSLKTDNLSEAHKKN